MSSFCTSAFSAGAILRISFADGGFTFEFSMPETYPLCVPIFLASF
jgi:hypothetical protein